jgi:hypothetical protein
MTYPNRRPLLISAILVALTSIPTMIVVVAGTATLHQRDRSRPPALARPADGPVIVGPGGAASLRERPRSASQSVQPMPLERRSTGGGSGGGYSISSRTGGRPETTVVAPAQPERTGDPSPPVDPPPVSPQPPAEHDCPPTDEPRMDDRAWPGWDRRLRTHPESTSGWTQ